VGERCIEESCRYEKLEGWRTSADNCELAFELRGDEDIEAVP
jgi:hypothetical protein